MENQERHKQKIEILARCIEAKVIKLEEALMLLDADIVKPEPEVQDSSSSKWNGQNYPYPSHPLIGTQTLPYYGTGSTPLMGTVNTGGNISTINPGSSTATVTTYPPGASITYTNTAGSAIDALSKHIK